MILQLVSVWPDVGIKVARFPIKVSQNAATADLSEKGPFKK